MLFDEIRQLGRVRASCLFLLGAAISFTTLALVVGQNEDAPRHSTSRSEPVELEGDAPLQRRLPLRRMIGMKLVTPMNGTRPTRQLLARIQRGELGGVIFFAHNLRDTAQIAVASRMIQRAARDGGYPPLPIFIDQEGGEIKRLPWAPPRRSPLAMGEAGPGVARREGAATGRALRAAGINVNLAPVADVRSSPSNFLGERAFGRTPARVERAACGFSRGLLASGIAPTFKHFPGLGAAPLNTDFAAVAITRSRSALRSDYRAYRTCPPPAIMISNASYPALDPTGLPAVLSRRIVATEVREHLAFSGVIISDAFGAPGPNQHRRSATRAVKAGVDMILWGPTDGHRVEDAYRELVEAARAGRLPRRELAASAARIETFRRGLEAPPKRPAPQSP